MTEPRPRKPRPSELEPDAISAAAFADWLVRTNGTVIMDNGRVLAIVSADARSEVRAGVVTLVRRWHPNAVVRWP
jgi:hypothetical protein